MRIVETAKQIAIKTWGCGAAFTSGFRTGVKRGWLVPEFKRRVAALEAAVGEGVDLKDRDLIAEWIEEIVALAADALETADELLSVTAEPDDRASIEQAMASIDGVITEAAILQTKADLHDELDTIGDRFRLQLRGQPHSIDKHEWHIWAEGIHTVGTQAVDVIDELLTQPHDDDEVIELSERRADVEATVLAANYLSDHVNQHGTLPKDPGAWRH